MELLEQLRAKISGFPGYDGELERRLSDEYVRSYLGEALADLAARDVLPPELRERVDEAILRVGFANQHAFAAHARGKTPDARDESAVAAADAATVALADRAASLDAASAASYLDQVTATLDKRDAAIRAAAPTMP
ncbi:MAG: hypothetical protein WAK84_04010 [Candidatus Cybelea sp.]